MKDKDKKIAHNLSITVALILWLISFILYSIDAEKQWLTNFFINYYGSISAPVFLEVLSEGYLIPFILGGVCFLNAQKFEKK